MTLELLTVFVGIGFIMLGFVLMFMQKQINDLQLRIKVFHNLFHGMFLDPILEQAISEGVDLMILEDEEIKAFVRNKLKGEKE